MAAGMVLFDTYSVCLIKRQLIQRWLCRVHSHSHRTPRDPGYRITNSLQLKSGRIIVEWLAKLWSHIQCSMHDCSCSHASVLEKAIVMFGRDWRPKQTRLVQVDWDGVCCSRSCLVYESKSFKIEDREASDQVFFFSQTDKTPYFIMK